MRSIIIYKITLVILESDVNFFFRKFFFHYTYTVLITITSINNNIILSQPLRAAYNTVIPSHVSSILLYTRVSYQIYGTKTFPGTLWSGVRLLLRFHYLGADTPEGYKNENVQRQWNVCNFYRARKWPTSFFPFLFYFFCTLIDVRIFPRFYDRTSLYFRTHVGRDSSRRVSIVFTTDRFVLFLFFSGGKRHRITNVAASKPRFAHGCYGILSVGDTRRWWS